MNFFGHDSNASNDPRIKKLIARYGFEGSGLYWHMIELITRHMDPPREQSCELQEDIETLAYAGRLDSEKCDEIVKFMIELGLFEITKSKKIRNTKVLRRLSDAQKRKVRRTETDNQRTQDGQVTDIVRGEVKRSEVEEKLKGIEKNRSEENLPPKPQSQGDIPKELDRLLKSHQEACDMLQNPKYGDDMIKAIKANIKLYEQKIVDWRQNHPTNDILNGFV